MIEEGLTEGYFGDRLFIDLAGEAFVKKLEWQGLGRPRGVGGIVVSGLRLQYLSK